MWKPSKQKLCFSLPLCAFYHCKPKLSCKFMLTSAGIRSFLLHWAWDEAEGNPNPWGVTGLAPGNQEDVRRGSAATIVISGRLEMKTKGNNYLKHLKIVLPHIKDQDFHSMGDQNSSSLFDFIKDISPWFQSNLPDLYNKHWGFHSKHLIQCLSQKVDLWTSVK